MQARNQMMRSPADIEIQYLKGIGEVRAKILRAHQIETLEDLFYLFPRRYLDRTTVRPIRALREGEEATVVGRVISAQIQKGRRERFILLVGDGTGFLQCVWFQLAKYWSKQFRVGESVSISGKLTYFNGLQVTHPDFDRLGETGEWETLNTGGIIPLYPSTESLTKIGFHSKGFRRVIRRALAAHNELITESLPDEILQQERLLPLRDALEKIHFPGNMQELVRAQERLKFEELFYLELMLALRRKSFRTAAQGIAFRDVGDKTRALIDRLRFSLTAAQRRVLREIWADMKSAQPMNRLLQGDVGSGKTIVALIVMLMAVENGYQAAMMAPTEILAEQHFINIHSLLEDIGVSVVLLTGRLRKKERERSLGLLASGEAKIAVGTHALIQADVGFQNLGLAIVDEQHRFGVMQRAQLRKKGAQPDVLVMTATPIPRTLSLTLHGDLDVSVLDELPAGRRPVRTVWRSSRKRRSVYEFVRDELTQGAQAYIVFPLVEESEKLDLRAAQETYEKVKSGFFEQHRVGLLHGRLASAEKEAMMLRFKTGELDLLIATTVIEVGVDVPNATIMVIEHAERFGLTQLHQLRGRVGRGEKESICILVVDTPLSAEARRRVETMCATNDGFRIAEVDLELRGPGEFFGTRQHGLPDLKIANIVTDGALLERAREAAFVVAEKPQLLQETVTRGRRYRFFRKFREKMELSAVG